MKGYTLIIFVFTFHLSSGTTNVIKDIHKLKQQASTNLHELAETAATNLKQLHDAAAAKLTNIKNVATPLLENIKVTAEANLKNWQETASTNLESVKDIASMEFQKIQENAATNIQQIADSIDLKKLKNLNLLNILPLPYNGIKITYRHYIPNEIPMIFDPYQGERSRHYFKIIHGDKGQRLVAALGAGLPIVVLRRIHAV